MKATQKPHLLKIIPPFENAIVIKNDHIAWDNPWHFHPEIEIIYCIKGVGTNFIGNSISSIEEGEILVMGKNLPHTRQRDKNYYTNSVEEPDSVVVQFKEDFLGEKFFRVKEFAHIKKMIDEASRGLKLVGETREIAARKLLELREKEGSTAIIELLSLLDFMARSGGYVFLNSSNYSSVAHEKASERINKVYQYTIENFRNPISLEDVAGLTNHSAAAFCRYFKTRTRKSYFQYLIEVRISYACNLLMEGNLDITRVAYESGFNNLSNFHKQFKRVVKMTPSEYVEKSRRKIRN